MTRRILLLGAGHAHLHVLRACAREPIADAELMLVTPSAEQVYSGLVPAVVAGRCTAAQSTIRLAPLAAAARVRLTVASASAVDADARQVRLGDGRVVGYDLLSLDTGATMDRDRLPGARDRGLFVRPIDAFVRLLAPLFELAAQRAMDIVVIGGGAAGVELAMAFEARMRPSGSRVALVTGGPEPLDGRAPRIQRLARTRLEARRITVFRDRCAAISARAVELDSGARLACDVPVIATGGEAPAWLAASGLALDAAGFVRIGATLQAVSHPEVLAVGDVARRADAPQMHGGVHAVRAAPALLANLRRMAGSAALHPYRPAERTLSLIACGDGQAFGTWGGWSASGRWVGWCKDRIDHGYVRRHVVAAGAGAASATGRSA